MSFSTIQFINLCLPVLRYGYSSYYLHLGSGCQRIVISNRGYQVIELFAGKKRISKLAKSIGLVTCAHDIMYDKNFTPKKTKGVLPTKSCMDINEPAGFLFLGFLGYHFTIIMLILCFCFGPNFHLLLKAIAPQNLNDTEPCSVRLCIITILRGRFGDLICMMGNLVQHVDRGEYRH